jgi:hypothetical protein
MLHCWKRLFHENTWPKDNQYCETASNDWLVGEESRVATLNGKMKVSTQTKKVFASNLRLFDHWAYCGGNESKDYIKFSGLFIKCNHTLKPKSSLYVFKNESKLIL